MDELVIQGKKYISSKRAAEITGYAKDYIGQLIRAGKLHGQRFGRAWYVEEAELLAHAKIESKSEAIQPSSQVLTPSTLKFEPKKLPPNFYQAMQLPKTWSSIKYLEDDADLLPVLYAKSELVTAEPALKISAAEAKPVIFEAKTALIQSTPARIPITVKARIEKELPERARVLVDGIKPKPAVMRIAVPNEDVQTPSPLKKPQKSDFPLVPVAAFSVMALFVIAIGFSGLFLSTEAIYVSQSEAYTSNVLLSFEDIDDLVSKSDFIQSGTTAVSDFFSILGNSFSDFLKKGFDFVNIF